MNPNFNNDVTNLITIELLANINLQEWVHSQPEILSQGRTCYWFPPSTRTTNLSAATAAAAAQEEEEEEEEDEELLDRDNIQVPAPLLRPIGDDKLLHRDQTPWSIGLTMSAMHEYSLCYVRSNVWPGAFTLGHATCVSLNFSHNL